MAPGFERASRPLSGRRILVTRRPQQASALVTLLRDLGAEVVEVPAIEVLPPQDTRALDEALRSLHRYGWIVFTSANAIRLVRERASALGLSTAALLSQIRIATVGPATTETLLKEFPDALPSLKPDVDFRAEGLVAAFAGLDVSGQRVLVPTSDRARDVLPAGLRSQGAAVDVVVAYRTVAPPGLRERLVEELRLGVDMVCFASSSAVESFVAVVPELVKDLPAAVIGPITGATARGAGMAVKVVAEPSTVEGLVRGLQVGLRMVQGQRP